jgi:hypothetical protein
MYRHIRTASLHSFSRRLACATFVFRCDGTGATFFMFNLRS